MILHRFITEYKNDCVACELVELIVVYSLSEDNLELHIKNIFQSNPDRSSRITTLEIEPDIKRVYKEWLLENMTQAMVDKAMISNKT